MIRARDLSALLALALSMSTISAEACAQEKDGSLSEKPAEEAAATGQRQASRVGQP